MLSKRAQIAGCLATGTILPAVLLALYFVVWAFNARVDSPLTWESTFPARLQFLPQLLVPLLSGAVVVWLAVRRGRLRWGIELGSLVTFAAYALLEVKQRSDLADCYRRAGGIDPLCGEGAAWVFLIWLGMFMVNTLALVGLGYWFNRFSKRKTSLTSQIKRVAGA